MAMIEKGEGLSAITNCYLIARRGDDGPLFSFAHKDGRGTVKLDRFLICPLEMFSKRQLKMAVKKYMRAAEL